MRVWISTLIASVIAVGCATADHEPTLTDPQGLAELRVDTSSLAPTDVSRVTVDAAGFSQDLAFNPATGTFDGTLFLPSGTQVMVGRAFAGSVLVAQSRPTSVEVQPGVVTRIVLHILDLSEQAPPLFGPIFDSLSFPTTTQVGAAPSFSASVIAPAGDPITYAWTSSCADSTFSAPTAASTTWSRPVAGPCTITITATSNGFSVAQGFVIVVFPAGAGSGAVGVTGLIVTAPSLFLGLGDLGCFVSDGSNASCSTTITAPTISRYELSVFNWGGASAGTLELSDNCGGTFGLSQRGPDFRTGFWLPPVTGGVCIITGHAVNSDGLSSTLSMAVLVRPGTTAVTQPPQIGVQLDNGCFIVAPSPSVDCGFAQAGAQRAVFGSVGWGNGQPGSVTISDDCVGAQPEPPNTSNFSAFWTIPPSPGGCTLTVRATNLQGVRTDAVAFYRVVGP